MENLVDSVVNSKDPDIPTITKLRKLHWEQITGQVKSVPQPSGSFSQSLSQFLWHEATRSIITPPGTGWSPSQGYPQAIYQAFLTICQFLFILLVRERHCPRTHHNVPARSETQTSASNSLAIGPQQLPQEQRVINAKLLKEKCHL